MALRWSRAGRFGAAALATMGLVATASVVTATVAAAHDDEGGSRFLRTDLVSDQTGVAAVTDPNLVNAWGLAFSPTSPLWVADNGTDVSTLYSGAVTPGSPLSIVPPVPLVVSIPGGAPTGIVFNGTTDFVVHNADRTASGPARFIFSSESGSITGWSPAVPPPPLSTEAQPAATVPEAVYKGLAMASANGQNYLYATNFHAGTVDVFDSTFTPVHLAGSFHDSRIPSDYAPFGIAALDGRIYVTFAKQDADRHDDVKGIGHGFVDVFDTQGNLLRRLVRRGALDSPWGLAIAPQGFGGVGGDLLVGNFGNGRIHAYDLRDGDFEATLRGAHGRAIQIDGLWGLLFGNGVAGSPQTLLFSAGPDGESHGLLGTITAAPPHHDDD